MLTEKELEILRRRSAGENQQSIAKSLRITQAAVSNFERKAHRKLVEAEQALGLAKTLGIQIEQGTISRRIRYGGGRK